MTRMALLTALVAIGAASTAHAEPLGSHQKHFAAGVGVRTGFVRNGGYDAFSTNDALVQFSVGAGRTLLARDRFSLAAVAFWDYGATSAEVRGAPAELDVHRLTLGPELRLHFAPWGYGLVRLLPAAVHTRASLEETTSQTTLYDRSWTFGFDASLGAAFQLYGKPSGASTKPRFWAVAEGGYGWATSADVSLHPLADDSDAPQRMSAVDLGQLAIRGGMFRISVVLTF
jgi:hypothetical protein